jgi:hypothetical protein
VPKGFALQYPDISAVILETEDSYYMKRAVILFALASLSLAAAPNFNGTWLLNVAKSEYGQFPAPQVMTRQIQQKDPALTMSTYQKGAQGEVTSELKYTTDGKPVINGENQGSAHWDGDKLVIESSRAFQGAQLKQREVWTLSADGKTLTVTTHVTLPNGEFDVKQVFEKAPVATAGTVRTNF